MRLVLLDAIYMARAYRSVATDIDPDWEGL